MSDGWTGAPDRRIDDGGVTAIAGASIAAPLATLDPPVSIGLGGILAGVATWGYLGRHDRSVCEEC